MYELIWNMEELPVWAAYNTLMENAMLKQQAHIFFLHFNFQRIRCMYGCVVGRWNVENSNIVQHVPVSVVLVDCISSLKLILARETDYSMIVDMSWNLLLLKWNGYILALGTTWKQSPKSIAVGQQITKLCFCFRCGGTSLVLVSKS